MKEKLLTVEKIEQRSEIKPFYLKMKSPTEIEAELDMKCGNASHSFLTGTLWLRNLDVFVQTYLMRSRPWRPKTHQLLK